MNFTRCIIISFRKEIRPSSHSSLLQRGPSAKILSSSLRSKESASFRLFFALPIGCPWNSNFWGAQNLIGWAIQIIEQLWLLVNSQSFFHIILFVFNSKDLFRKFSTIFFMISVASLILASHDLLLNKMMTLSE